MSSSCPHTSNRDLVSEEVWSFRTIISKPFALLSRHMCARKISPFLSCYFDDLTEESVMKQAKRSISIISFSTFILMGCSGNVPGKEGSHRPYIESAPTADSLTIKTTKHSTTIRWKKVVSWNKSIDGRSLDFKVCGKRSNGTSLQCMDKTQTAFWKTFEAPKGFVVQHYSTDHEGLFTVVLLRTRLPVRLNGSKPLYKFIVVWAKKRACCTLSNGTGD